MENMNINTYNTTDTTTYMIILSVGLHISKKKLEDFSLTTKTTHSSNTIQIHIILNIKLYASSI